MFKKNKKYNRLNDLHKKYGGNRRGGISNCPDHPIIFIFSGPTGKKQATVCIISTLRD